MSLLSDNVFLIVSFIKFSRTIC